MLIDNVFELAQTVYLVTDPEQRPRLVTCISVRPEGLKYELSHATMASWHYAFEISTTRNALASLT